MSDLISRRALCEYALNQKDKSITPNDIMRFPSAQQWIPVTERLPEEKTRVLATVLTQRRELIVISGEYIMGAFCCDNGFCWMADGEEVVAWMPLPQPYEGGQE